MENLKGVFCGIVGVIGSLVINFLGGWNSGLATLFVCIVLDYITGLIVAGIFKNSTKTESGALESRAGLKGLVRKIMMINEYIEPVGAMERLYMTCIVE